MSINRTFQVKVQYIDHCTSSRCRAADAVLRREVRAHSATSGPYVVGYESTCDAQFVPANSLSRMILITQKSFTIVTSEEM